MDLRDHVSACTARRKRCIIIQGVIAVGLVALVLMTMIAMILVILLRK